MSSVSEKVRSGGILVLMFGLPLGLIAGVAYVLAIRPKNAVTVNDKETYKKMTSTGLWLIIPGIVVLLIVTSIVFRAPTLKVCFTENQRIRSPYRLRDAPGP
jgi:hypothetical protein